MRFTLVAMSMLLLAGLVQAKPDKKEASPPPAPNFSSTPALDIASHHDFAASEKPNDDIARQLHGLSTIADFEALPSSDRYIYSFDQWPAENNDLKLKSFCFNFHLGTEAMPALKVDFAPQGGGPGGVRGLVRTADSATKSYALTGFGNLDWGGISTHRFWFNRPVRAFGVVLKSQGDVAVQRFYWPAAKELNGFPVSYLLSDGTVVNLGVREARGALIKAGTDSFLGIIDHSGRGIVAVTYTLKGLGGNKAQPISMSNIAFVTMAHPAEAPAISLKSQSDFDDPQTIAKLPQSPADGLLNLDDFRFIAGTHRFVYGLDTWPSGVAVKGPAASFPLDLDGQGAASQTVTVAATNKSASASVSKETLKDGESLPYHVLACEGVGDDPTGEIKVTFSKPVWACGVTYRPAQAVDLRGPAGAYAIDYTLSDGTVVNIGTEGASAGTIQANQRTFVGVIDRSDKGIVSMTLRMSKGAGDKTPVYIDDIAFAMAGPPPGNWKMTLNENFDGDKLNPDLWSTGYKFVDVINNELQGYVPENVVVANGVCTIKAEHRDCHNTDRFGNVGQAQHFASGAFTSVDKWTQTYGYFEARIKMPKARGAGVWPAFWMLPDRGREFDDKNRYSYMTANHGRGMEIDIFEFMPWWKQLNGRFPIHMGCIWSYGPVTEKDPAPHGYGSYALDNDGWGPRELTFANLDNEFHTYGLYWSKDRLIFYVDSKPVFRVKDAKHVPNVPHFFLFNVAVQGNGWGKSPDKSNPTMKQMIADMPNQMEIDYFRAYSGTLQEDVPVADETQTGDEAQPPQTAAPTTSAGNGPTAPVNSRISTPSN